jgi:hypothetical protein
LLTDRATVLSIRAAWRAALIMLPLWSAPAVAASSTGDSCASLGAPPARHGAYRITIERDAAIDIVAHAQRACTLIANLVRDNVARKNPRLAVGLGAIVEKLNKEALEYIHLEYPDLRGKDLAATPAGVSRPSASGGGETSTADKQPALPKMGPATATYLRWAIHDIRTSFSHSVEGQLCDAREAEECFRSIMDIDAEIGLAEAPIYRSFPGLWRLSMKQDDALAASRPRTTKGDAAFRKFAPRLGSVKLSPAAATLIRDFLTSIERDIGHTCQVASISWSLGGEWKGPNDADWTKTPAGVDVGAYGCRQVPADVVQTINGIRIVFGGDSASRFEGKLVDLEGKKFILKEQ